MRIPRATEVLQLARFGTVGASKTIVSFVAYAVALQLGVRYLPAGAGAFALGATNGFVLNRTWTFRHRGPALAAGWRRAARRPGCRCRAAGARGPRPRIGAAAGPGGGRRAGYPALLRAEPC